MDRYVDQFRKSFDTMLPRNLHTGSAKSAFIMDGLKESVEARADSAGLPAVQKRRLSR